MERDENERASDVALPNENEARPIGEIVASLMVEIEKSGGSNATPSRHKCSTGLGGEMRFGAGSESHARLTPLRLAKAFTFSKRQEGMPPLEVFQLDTVDGVSLRARATSTVPPKASIMSVAVCMTALLR